jgi:hypothetical protein
MVSDELVVLQATFPSPSSCEDSVLVSQKIVKFAVLEHVEA